MAVVGKHSIIFDKTGLTCTVNSFTESTGSLKNVPIVDAAIAYECPRRAQTYILLLRNALHIPEMEYNLLPPFLIREAGLSVDECPKYQSPSPSIENHSIHIETSDLRIPLKLNGTFSYFDSRIPTIDELRDCDKIFITPDSTEWDPYKDSYSINEDAMTDAWGNITTYTPRRNELDNDTVEEYTPIEISAVESHIDEVLETSIENSMHGRPHTSSAPIQEAHQVSSALLEKTIRNKFLTSMEVGSICPSQDTCNLFLPNHLDEEYFQSNISALNVEGRAGTNAKSLAKCWTINEADAQLVIEHSTQLNRKSSDGLLSRHFSTNDRMLRYRRINSTFFTDTMFVTKSAKSTRGNTMMQIYVSDRGYLAVHPMERKSQFIDSLQMFYKEVGAPNTLVVDPAGEQTSNNVRKLCNQVGTTLRILEESTQWANRAELYIRILKEAIRQDIKKSNCPMVLWDYCAERRALIHNLIPRKLFQDGGKSPYEILTGTPGDISNLCQFQWYEWCYYREEAGHLFPHQKEYLGRVLGPSKNEGNEMAQNVLNSLGNVLARRSLRKLTQHEIEHESEKRLKFDEAITTRWGDSITLPEPKPEPTNYMDPDPEGASDPGINSEDDEASGEGDHDAIMDEPPEEDPIDPQDGKPVFEQPLNDILINAEVLLPTQGKTQTGRVKSKHQ